MPESNNLQEFDFSKPEDQARFDALPEEEKDRLASVAMEEADKIKILNKKQDLINNLTKGDYISAFRLLKAFPLPEAELKSPEVQVITKQGLINCLTRGDYIAETSAG